MIEMNFLASTESQENKKNPVVKCYPLLGSEPRISDFTALHATI